MAMTTEVGKYAGVNFTYDQVGRLNSTSRVTNWDPATTINTSFTLDLLDRVTSITHSKVSGELTNPLSQFSYTYDANGRVIASTGPEGSLSFALDANGQLLSVTGSRSEAYAFDTNGNRSTNTTSAGNLLLSDGHFSYTYDLEGNRKTRTRLSDGQLTECFWDHRNQLTKALVKDANGVLLKELRFTYDVEGRRVGVWVDADGVGPGAPDQVWTIYDGANPYMDFDAQGNVKDRYLYGPGIDELFARIGAGEDPQWYLTDRLGSVRQIVDGSGTILDDIVYDSFGNVLSESNPGQGDRFKFTGREFSPELGIYYYRARWYDPATGRFISQDPIGFQAGDPNLYRYVGNAPGDGTDSEGLFIDWNWWGTAISEFPSAVASTFTSGEAIDSLTGAVVGLVDMTAGTNFNLTAKPLYENWAAFEQGQGVGHVWAGVNSVLFLAQGGHLIGKGGIGIFVSETGLLSFSVAGEGSLTLITGLISTSAGGNTVICMGRHYSGRSQGNNQPVETLQTGGNTVYQSTANALGLEKWKAGEALEKLKLDSGLPPNYHGNILSNGNYVDPKTGKVLGNIFEYVN